VGAGDSLPSNSFSYPFTVMMFTSQLPFAIE